MGLEGRINARTTAPYHVQLQLEGKSAPSRSPSEVVLQGRVVRIFRGDGRLGSGDCVAFKLWVCQPGDAPTGPAFIYYEAFMQATHIEAYLYGTPPNCQLAAHEFEALNGPTDEPMMTVAQLQELAVPVPYSATEQSDNRPSTDGQAQQGFSVLAYVGIVVGICLAIVKALVWSKGVFTSEVFGYALAGALIPGAIAYAIAGRKKVRNPNRFALWFVSLCIFFLLFELAPR